MGMEGGGRQGHNLDDRSSVTRTEARRFLIWWGKGMRATAVERSKAPWPQWPALDRLPLSGRGSSVLLPSGHCPRAAPSVVGACLRERTRGTAGAHQHHHTHTHTHTKKKPSLSPSVGPRRAFLPTVLALFGCPFWCLSSVLLGLNVLCAVSPRPAHHTEPLGVSASMQSRHLQSASTSLSCPSCPSSGASISLPITSSSATSECPQQVTASVHDYPTDLKLALPSAICPRAAGSGPVLALCVNPLSRLLSASSRLASPRIWRVKILSHSKPPPGAIQAPPAEP